MSVVFLDTVGLIGLWDATDQWHSAATAAKLSLNHPSVRLVTTSFVLLECGNAAARKPYRTDVYDLWERLQREGDLIMPTGNDIEAAWVAYRQAKPGAPGIVDYLSFTIMRRLSITDVFSNDHHFKAAGFNTLF